MSISVCLYVCSFVLLLLLFSDERQEREREMAAQLTVIILVFSEHLFDTFLSLRTLAACKRKRRSEPSTTRQYKFKLQLRLEEGRGLSVLLSAVSCGVLSCVFV